VATKLCHFFYSKACLLSFPDLKRLFARENEQQEHSDADVERKKHIFHSKFLNVLVGYVTLFQLYGRR
jgi:hypothetical protein